MNNEIPRENKIMLYNRAHMELTGITDVESFTDTSVSAVSDLGEISIEGQELRIDSFSTGDGNLVIDGKIDAVFYFGRERGHKKKLFSGGTK